MFASVRWPSALFSFCIFASNKTFNPSIIASVFFRIGKTFLNFRFYRFWFGRRRFKDFIDFRWKKNLSMVLESFCQRNPVFAFEESTKFVLALLFRNLVKTMKSMLMFYCVSNSNRWNCDNSEWVDQIQKCFLEHMNQIQSLIRLICYGLVLLKLKSLRVFIHKLWLNNFMNNKIWCDLLWNEYWNSRCSTAATVNTICIEFPTEPRQFNWNAPTISWINECCLHQANKKDKMRSRILIIITMAL